MPVLMNVSRILISEMQDLQIIELKEEDGERTFPILIGITEAEAIRRRLQGVTLKRPLTHELLESVIRDLGAVLESMSITDLSEHTFFATLNLRNTTGELIEVDARPSDAIALTIGKELPIYVDEQVLEQAANEL